MTFYRRAAFTLIELLIVCAITVVLAGSLGSVALAIHNSNARLATRAAAQTDIHALMDRWRTDVWLAESITCAPEGDAMTIRRSGTAGETLRVRYGRASEGGLERRIEREGGGEDAHRRASAVERVAFHARGNAWVAQWTLADDDGLSTRRWGGVACATPFERARPPRAGNREETR